MRKYKMSPLNAKITYINNRGLDHFIEKSEIKGSKKMFRKPIQKVDFNEIIRELITTVECYNEGNRTHGNGDFRLVNEEKELLIKSDDRKYLLKISVQDIKSIKEIDNDSTPDMEWEYD